MSKTRENAGGIIIENRSILMVRPEGKDFFISPGGGIEGDESPEEALCRELEEEITIKVSEQDLSLLGIYTAEAKGRPGEKVKMHAFFVNYYEGDLSPSSEIAELGWFNTKNVEPNSTGSIYRYFVIPELKKRDLID